jgi:hypothetical protein
MILFETALFTTTTIPSYQSVQQFNEIKLTNTTLSLQPKTYHTCPSIKLKKLKLKNEIK